MLKFELSLPHRRMKFKEVSEKQFNKLSLVQKAIFYRLWEVNVGDLVLLNSVSYVVEKVEKNALKVAGIPTYINKSLFVPRLNSAQMIYIIQKVYGNIAEISKDENSYSFLIKHDDDTSTTYVVTTTDTTTAFWGMTIKAINSSISIKILIDVFLKKILR